MATPVFECATDFFFLFFQAGSAISAFKDPIVIESPRLRFVPVKTTSDLLIAQSNVYVIKVSFFVPVLIFGE